MAKALEQILKLVSDLLDVLKQLVGLLQQQMQQQPPAQPPPPPQQQPAPWQQQA